MASRKEAGLDRRAFLSKAVAGGAGAALAPAIAEAQAPQSPAPSPSPAPAPPGAAALAREHEIPASETGTMGRSGSDYMVDALKQLDIDYVATMPGSSFRALHESLINYGGNRKPELLTCVHEEISVALAHGYAKVAGKPMAVMAHGVVGVQHAAMAIYNAWADRIPVVVLVGNALDSTQRRPGPEWDHSALDNGALVRDFTKWDAQPASLRDFNEALKRAYSLAVTAPTAPVLLTLDGELQERGIDDTMRPPALTMTPSHPVGDPAALAEAARMLIAASDPIIIADRLARTQDGMTALVELAELLQAPVIDKYSRLNMPTTHPLCQTDRARALVSGADVILGLELTDPWGAIDNLLDLDPRRGVRTAKASAKLISITSHDLLIKANYQDFQRYQASDLQISGDGEATLPLLVDAVKRILTPSTKNVIAQRGTKLRGVSEAMRAIARKAAAVGWNARPISTGRLCAEVWAQVQDHDWALVGGDYQFKSNWPQRLWPMDKVYQFPGGAGGAGVGYCLPAAVGGALAHREHGRLAVNLQGDGDFMCAPGSLWTAAHHKIPLLTVVHNNRAYHQEEMHVQRMADRHGRGIDRASIGTTLNTPNIDYAKMAESQGVAAFGPVTDPGELAGVLKRAVDIAAKGEPVLVDVVSEGR